MSKTLVTYYSKTGNTKKIAEAIYEQLKGEKEIKPLDEVQGLEDYSLIFIGFPVYSHSVPYKVEIFLKKIPDGKKIALFSTHGSFTGSRLSREALEHATATASKAKVMATFSCRGRVSLETLEMYKNSPQHVLWVEMAASARNHPHEKDVENAKSFARWVITLNSQK